MEERRLCGNREKKVTYSFLILLRKLSLFSGNYEKAEKNGKTTFLENIVREVPNQIHHPFQFLIYCMWYHQLCYTDSSIFISPLCWSSILRHGYVQFDTPFGPKSRITYN